MLLETPATAQAHLMLERGDRICIIGNTLAERMQHDGWLETLMQNRFPEHQLVFRNLAFPTDELTIQLRGDGFGSMDEHLASHKADVILAFFGFNESFAGPEGLDKFKQDLTEFIEARLAKQYNDESPPRLALVSPIAHENIHDKNFPDGTAANKRLELYTDAMASVAKAHNVPFVDAFHPTLTAYGLFQESLTINGCHLDTLGNRVVASIITRSLFSTTPQPKRDGVLLTKIRAAVVDKNFYWFQRYRTTDGFNVHGGRSHLKYLDDQTNRVVLQREMKILDAMTANRDQRIWTIAQGGDHVVDDHETPDFIAVKTNRPGPGPEGKHIFLSGEEVLTKLKPHEGLKVNLVASEEMFPELVNPVQMAFDTKGRLWIAAWRTYPHWKPKDPMDDKLLILEDENGDGRAERCKVFADDLHNPTGFEFWNGGVFVATAPDLWFLEDTDGDDRADMRRRVLGALGSGDTHHSANSFVFDPGGALYFQEGTFHRTAIETPYGPVRNRNGCVWRFEPRTWKVDRYIPYNFANPHGHVFDAWGQDFVYDGTGAVPYHGTLFSGHIEFPEKHPKPPQLYAQRTRPCPAVEILSSRHFPENMQGNLIVGNVITVLGFLQYRVDEDGASFKGTETAPLLESSHQNFRPSDVEIGPDGAIWFTDWHNPIIGHMQHHLRDPSRDQAHGRVYRITYPSRPLVKPAKIYGEPIENLLDLLKEHENRVRSRARAELSDRNTDAVIAAVAAWVATLDDKHPEHQQHLLEALWVHQQHNVVNEELLRGVLRSPDYRARAAATRVLCYWRDRVSGALELLKRQAVDEHPRVRLEAVRACSFFKDARAAEVALESVNHPQDKFLEFTLEQTLKTLDKQTSR